MRRGALIAFAVGLLAVLAFEIVPWLARTRDFPAEIPNPPPLQTVSLDVLPGGNTLCMRDIAAETHSRQVRFVVGTYGKPGPPLVVTVTAPGYRSVARRPAGFADNATLRLPITAPPRATLVTACIKNGGERKIALYAAADSAKSRATVEIAGRPTAPTPTFGFWEPKPTSIAARAGVTIDRMATFRGFLGHPSVLSALLALFCLGIPVALGIVLWRGLPR